MATDHFGNWLREQIAIRGMPQTQFAREFNIPIATIRSWVAQLSPKIRRDKITILANALGINRRELTETLKRSRSIAK